MKWRWRFLLTTFVRPIGRVRRLMDVYLFRAWILNLVKLVELALM